MAARVSRLAPPAAQAAPDQETRERGLKALRLELEAQSDAGLQALLQHEIARLHERREDLASAARDELATTKLAAGFVAPLESLIDIATRSRSKANLAKLLGRLTKLARTTDEKLRASLALALTHLSSEDLTAAQETLETALDETPTESALWIALETVAAASADMELLLKAATGRAAHAQSDEMRCLLLERAARLHVELGNGEAAFAALRQSVDELPTWRALHAWEELGLRANNYEEAGRAATQTATILRAGLEEPEEAELYQIPREELNEERAIAAHIRAIIYAIRAGDDEEARGLCEQLSEASPDSVLTLALLAELCRKQGDFPGAFTALSRLIEARKWNNKELAIAQCLASLAARSCGNQEEAIARLESVSACAPEARLPQIHRWLAAEAADHLGPLESLLEAWADAGDAPFHLAVVLVMMLGGRFDEANQRLDQRPASEDDGPIPALLQYALGHLTPARATRLTLPPHIGTAKDQVALNWEALRTGLTGDADDLDAAASKAEDPWARLALSLLHSEIKPPPVIAPLRAPEEPAVPTASPPASIDVETATSEVEVPSAPPYEGSPAAEDDGVIQGLTQESPSPVEVDVAEETGESARVDQVDETDPAAEPPNVPEIRHSSAPPPSGVRGAIETYLNSGTSSPELGRALRVYLIATTGDRDGLRSLWERDPGDPLLAGALLALLETDGDPSLGAVRKKIAAKLHDETLRGALLLRSAAACLAERKGAAASEAIEAADALPNADTLGPWFAALKAEDDPKKALADYKMSPPRGEGELEYAALLRRHDPEDWSSFEAGDPCPALQILQVLHTATVSLEAFEYALDETQLFSEAERAALPLARKFAMDASGEFLDAAKRWTRVSPSSASQITQLVAATRDGDFTAQSEMISALSQELASQNLLTAVPAARLKKPEREAHRARLVESRDQAEGIPRARLAWAVAEELDDEISETHACEIRYLADSLDTTLHDPDAQAALLLAGYEYLAMARYEDAVEVFEHLLEMLPGDLTLCQGARLAAAQVGRPDLEAITTVELAKSTEDNIKSAALWERAGVLFQDALDDPEEAEKCFTAALSRSPGSRLSFERIYRFARDRNDRQRQVELIDSRLDTAESETLQIDLYWEKARFCRMLGRRAIALRSLEELLRLAPDHLPALALAAELHLVDGRIDRAADALKAVAKHPDTPPAERSAAGLHACDLFEQLRKPREAVELLQVLDEYGVSGSAGLERRARSLARSGDWGEAFAAFAELNAEQDEIGTRLESARMMLAIQRDHLKDPEELKRSARSVLRDAPVDPDAIHVILEQSFPPEERRRLLSPARRQSVESLRKMPLNPPEIQRFAGLCLDCGEDYLERVALGNLGLTGKLPDQYESRLETLLSSCLGLPSQPLSRADLEHIADPLQIGSAGRYIHLISPYLSEELDPSLDALGFSSLMRTDEFSGSPHRAEIGVWVGAFGDNDFELYVGGTDPHLIRGLHGDLPTLLVGKEVPIPLTPLDRARVVAQLSALHYDTVTFLNHSPEELQKWMLASEILAGGKSSPETAGEVDEMARRLSKRVPRDVREELAHLRDELTRAGVVLSEAPHVIMRGAARAVCLAQGEAKILRQLPELLPESQDALNLAMADIVRFVLSDAFITIRRKLGLEGT